MKIMQNVSPLRVDTILLLSALSDGSIDENCYFFFKFLIIIYFKYHFHLSFISSDFLAHSSQVVGAKWDQRRLQQT